MLVRPDSEFLGNRGKRINARRAAPAARLPIDQNWNCMATVNASTSLAPVTSVFE